MNQTTLRSIALWKAIMLFAFTSALIYISIYFFIPKLINYGLTFLQSYLICFYTPFAVIFIISLIAFRMENPAYSWALFKERYRLNKIDKKTFIWIIGLSLFILIAYVSLTFTGKLLSTIPWLAPPSFFPAEINPNKLMISGVFMDTPLSGKWWIIPIYFLGWFLNIFGEEFLWRGFILPRQEIMYGKYAWLIHGSIWTLWHIFWKWNLLIILPVAFSIPFVVQKTKNTWTGIIAHGIVNFIPLIIIIIGVLS
jgi:membrane protease YdiL (CAAX protease family)